MLRNDQSRIYVFIEIRISITRQELDFDALYIHESCSLATPSCHDHGAYH